MVIVDLGCSSGPNTLLFISNVIRVIADQQCKSSDGDPVELQFILNDLPGNDFNELFRAVEKFKKSDTTDQLGRAPPFYYISGLPESYYKRLFPHQSVHLFHSSYCLHWRSQVFVPILTRCYLCISIIFFMIVNYARVIFSMMYMHHIVLICVQWYSQMTCICRYLGGEKLI